jgi:hypothetical protein
VQPFLVTLESFELFKHKKSATLWLRPVTEDPLAFDRLQGALQEAVPECHEQRTKHGDRFTAHMTVTHFDLTKMAFEECEKLRDELQQSWTSPVTFVCEEVHIMTRKQDGQFRRRARIFLGSSPSKVAGTKNVCQEELEDWQYPHMPSEVPEFCKVPSSPSRSKWTSTARRREKPLPLPEVDVERLLAHDVVEEVEGSVAELLGVDAATRVSLWLSSGNTRRSRRRRRRESRAGRGGGGSVTVGG